MTTDFITTARRGAVLEIRLNRPQAANALNRDMLGAIQATLAAAREDANTGAVLLSSQGNAFSAGVDLKEMIDSVPQRSQQLRRDALCQTLMALAAFPKPVVTAVQGPAVGAGCMLAFLADVLVASDAALFSLPEVALGMPTPIAATIAQWRGGAPLARHMVLGGEKCAAGDARVGAVSPGPGAALDDVASRCATRLASQPADAYASTKSWLAQTILQQLELAAAEARRLAERTLP